MEAPVEIPCAQCGKSFEKAAREYRRQIKNGRTHFFCGRSCNGRASNLRTPRQGDASRLTPANRLDEFTPFRWFLRGVVRRRNQKGPTDLTLDYLQELWGKQNGTCPLTGWSLILPDSTNGWRGSTPIEAASLDRIDSRKGYTQGNVRFVAVIANYAKNSFTDADLIRFCHAVTKKAS